MTAETRRVGFIGLGVMGEPMCRNLALKTKLDIVMVGAEPELFEKVKPLMPRSPRTLRCVGRSAAGRCSSS